MSYTKEDLAHGQNILRALSKAQHNLEGMEVLALADAMRWLTKLNKGIELELQTPPKAEIKEQQFVTPEAPPASKRKK